MKNEKIVIRCHPSENTEVYKKISKKYKGVYFDENFSIHPWILSCQQLVNHYCTTTFEGLIANKNVYSLKPYNSSNMENKDFFKITTIAKNYKDLLKKIKKNKKIKLKKKLIKSYALNFDNKIDSSKIISKIINEKYFKKNNSKKTKSINIKKYLLKHRLKSLKNLIRLGGASHYISHKIKIITKKEIYEFIKKFKKFQDKIIVKELTKNFFEISSV